MGILSTAYDISGLAEADIDSEVCSDHSAFKLDLWQLQRQLVFGEASSSSGNRRARGMLPDDDPPATDECARPLPLPPPPPSSHTAWLLSCTAGRLF